MEIITKSPGLQHISETFFELLEKKDLLNCRLVNKSWKKVLDQPNFWFKKLETEDVPNVNLMNKSLKTRGNIHKTWKTLAQNLENGRPEEEFALVLIWFHKRNPIESIHPLEIVVDFAKAKKNSAFVKFVIENVDITTRVDLKEDDTALDLFKKRQVSVGALFFDLFHFFQFLVTLHSGLIARFFAVLSLFHTQKFFW